MDINTECFDANYEDINVDDTIVILHLDSKKLATWYDKQPSGQLKITKLVPSKEQVYVEGYNNPIDMLSVLKMETKKGK